MRTRLTAALAGVVTAATVGGFVLAPTDATARPARTVQLETGMYDVDSVHSTIIFAIGHAKAANFYGRFNDPTGSITFDPNDVESASFEISVKAENIDTANKDRDDHLRGPDFFKVRQFPTIDFKSTSVKPAGDDLFTVEGELTMHGVTKAVTVEMELIGQSETRMGKKIGFETTFKIMRTDFGMDTYAKSGMLGDEVKLIVAIEADAKG